VILCIPKYLKSKFLEGGCSQESLILSQEDQSDYWLDIFKAQVLSLTGIDWDLLDFRVGPDPKNEEVCFCRQEKPLTLLDKFEDVLRHLPTKKCLNKKLYLRVDCKPMAINIVTERTHSRWIDFEAPLKEYLQISILDHFSSGGFNKTVEVSDLLVKDHDRKSFLDPEKTLKQQKV